MHVSFYSTSVFNLINLLLQIEKTVQVYYEKKEKGK